MSLFTRVLTRAALPGHPTPPLARPKGLVGGIARAPAPEQPDEAEDVAPLARAAVETPDESEEASPLRRAPNDLEDEKPASPLRRTAEAEDQPATPLRRQGDVPSEDEAQPLRRVTAPDKDEAAPLRRATQPPDEDEKAVPLRRAAATTAQRYPVLPTLVLREAPEAEALTAENSPSPAENSAQPENEPAMALRREATRPGAVPPQPQVAGPIFDPPQAQTPVEAPERVGPPDLWQAFEPERTAPHQPEPQWPAHEPATDRPQQTQGERPRVVIEQIDVSITEPASAGQSQADFAANLSRAIRSRYLGR